MENRAKMSGFRGSCIKLYVILGVGRTTLNRLGLSLATRFRLTEKQVSGFNQVEFVSFNQVLVKSTA
jgi:hypothetical protein